MPYLEHFNCLRVLFLICIFSSIQMGCKPVQNKKMWSLQDTLKLKNMLEGEFLASKLFVDSKLIDSIDVQFGVHEIGKDSLLYLSVSNFGEDSAAYRDNYYILKDTIKSNISSSIPIFNSNFSSPSLIDNHFHYWGLKESDTKTGNTDIFAMKYNFSNHKIDSVFLGNYLIATDFRDYFKQPSFENENYYYQNENYIWTLNKSFQLLQKSKSNNKNQKPINI